MFMHKITENDIVVQRTATEKHFYFAFMCMINENDILVQRTATEKHFSEV